MSDYELHNLHLYNYVSKMAMAMVPGLPSAREENWKQQSIDMDMVLGDLLLLRFLVRRRLDQNRSQHVAVVGALRPAQLRPHHVHDPPAAELANQVRELLARLFGDIVRLVLGFSAPLPPNYFRS